MRLLLGVLISLLMLGEARAQVAPAQMGITPTTVPEVLQVLDAHNIWVPIGTVDPNLHIFSGGSGTGGAGSGTVTNMLSGRPNSTWTASFHAGGTCPQSNNAMFPPPPAPQPPAVFCGGTEGRQFAVKNPGTISSQLYLGNGYWMDQPGPEGPQNAQILVLNGPVRPPYNNVWQQDVNLGQTGLAPGVGAVSIGSSPVTSSQYCPTDNPVCALSVGALQTISFTNDDGQNGPFNPPVNILVASSWWEGTTSWTGPLDGTVTCSSGQTPVFAWARNNTLSPLDLRWYQTLIECDPGAGSGTPQIRAFGSHVDLQDNAPGQPQDYIFAGASPAGIYRGQLSRNRGFGSNPISWNFTGPEWHGSDYPTSSSFPQCTAQTRVMGFAEATGSDGVKRLYMSACFAIYYRVDGGQGPCLSYQVLSGSCVPRWKLYWNWADPLTGPGHPVTQPVSMSGLRGLTGIPGENVLLIGAEGASPMAYFAIKPFPACATPTDTTCYTIEYLVYSQTANALDPAHGTFTLGNTVAPYNNYPQVFDETGLQHFLAPQSSYIAASTTNLIPPWTFMYLGDSSGGNGKKLAEAIYTFRSSAGKYNLAYVPQLFSTPMNGVRDMAVSPFSQDCGYYGSSALSCAIYATGNDADGSTLYYWCRANPCPNPPAVPPYVPMHNMAWVARGGYPGP